MADYNIEDLNLLLIDDNENMRGLVTSIARALGIRHIKTATDGNEAFNVLKHFPADIVVCDWIMEPVDGIAFVKKIREIDTSPNPFIPVIMLTAHSDIERVMTARDAGVNEFLVKPISPGSLYSRIKSIIEFERKFIKVSNYFGLDRRRNSNVTYHGENRRKIEDVTDSQDKTLIGNAK